MEKRGKALKEILLLTCFIAVVTTPLSVVSASGDAVIFIDPASISGINYAPSTDIAIAVLVANISDLNIAIFNVSYEPPIFGFRSLSIGALSYGPQPTFQISDEKGFFWLNISYNTPITTSSSIMLVNITFSILAQGETILDLHDTSLSNSEGEPIPHMALDGYFINFNPYDLNLDGIVDIGDIAIVARAFGSYPGHPRWDPEADLDGNNKVDIIDVALIAGHFGEY